ncbi:hypothetical protein EC988_004476, partial [Linderina pennispora]
MIHASDQYPYPLSAQTTPQSASMSVGGSVANAAQMYNQANYHHHHHASMATEHHHALLATQQPVTTISVAAAAAAAVAASGPMHSIPITHAAQAQMMFPTMGAFDSNPAAAAAAAAAAAMASAHGQQQPGMHSTPQP